MLDFLMVPPEVLGIIGAFVAGLLSLVPALGATDTRRNLTAIVVLILGIIFFGDFVYESIQQAGRYFIEVAVFAVVFYKIFLQNFVVEPIQRALAKSSNAYRVAMARRS